MEKSREGFAWRHARDFCDTLSLEEDALTRSIVSCISDKWSLWTMAVIAEHRRPMRFSRIMEEVEGVSQKSLTKTLRGLERDGLVTREVFAEVPPRVEYALTPLGAEMLDSVAPFWLWVAKSVSRFKTARAAFDGRPQRFGARNSTAT